MQVLAVIRPLKLGHRTTATAFSLYFRVCIEKVDMREWHLLFLPFSQYLALTLTIVLTGLVDVTYAWATGARFVDICEQIIHIRYLNFRFLKFTATLFVLMSNIIAARSNVRCLLPFL
jgi:hypothetical protein